MATIEEVLGRDIAFKGDLVVTATGDLDTISGLANVKEALYRRLVTRPGSLIHRPNYGVGIQDFQNSLSSLEKQRELALRIQEQFTQDPRVQSVEGVRVDFDDLQPDVVKIMVRVKLVGYDEVTATFIPFGGE